MDLSDIKMPAGNILPHAAAQSRSYGIPSPPRIFVPPPLLIGSGAEQANFFSKSSGSATAGDAAGFKFLATVNDPQYQLRGHVMDWRYEERRFAQEILPFLYLGPVGAARDRDFLQRAGITMVLAIRSSQMGAMQMAMLAPKMPRELGLETATVDLNGNMIIPSMRTAIEHINAHLAPRYHSWPGRTQTPSSTGAQGNFQLPGKVLVMCESGNEKSAAVVAAYILAMYPVDLVQALQIVQSQRFCVSIDDRTRHILRSFEDLLKAQADVDRRSESEGGMKLDSLEHEGSDVADASRGNAKRTIDQAYDDENMADVDGALAGESLARREGLAPFAEAHIS